MIELKHIRKEYEEGTPIEDLSTVINDGEVVTIIGPSGTGKSTLLRMINMLERPTSGQIFIDGEEVTAPGYPLNKLRMKVSMVFQSFNLFNHMTVIENVCYAPMVLRGKDPSAEYDEGMALLEKVGMKAHAMKYPDQLSGGQKQRVAIARTIAMEPKVILLDEPTSALDPTMVGEVEKVIQALCTMGYTILLVTHDMRFAEKVSSRVIFLCDGGIYEDGTPQQIFHDMKGEKTRAFIKQLKSFRYSITPQNADYISFYTELTRYTLENDVDTSIKNRITAFFEELCFQILIPKLQLEGIQFSIGLYVEYYAQEEKAEIVIDYVGPEVNMEDEDLALPLSIVRHCCDSMSFEEAEDGKRRMKAVINKTVSQTGSNI